MKPSALLVTMNRYWGVANRLRDAAARAPRTIDVRVETPLSFDDVPRLLRSNVDLLALDGHGWTEGNTAYFGSHNDLQLSPRRVRGEYGEGIAAPIVVFGFCHGGTAPFLNALATVIDRPTTAFLGCTRKGRYDDAARVYPPLLTVLARLGTDPDPAEAQAQIKPLELVFGPAWRTTLVSGYGEGW